MIPLIVVLGVIAALVVYLLLGLGLEFWFWVGFAVLVFWLIW